MTQSKIWVLVLNAFQGRHGLCAVSKILIDDPIKGSERCSVMAGPRHELVNDGHVIVRNVEVAVLSSGFLQAS